jgi:2,3-bisphosphoglycerate-independent phosphoglycerate mutase
MMLWDGDLGVPGKYLVSPAPVADTVSEVISIAGLTQFAVAETQKFGHITYFWNGNRAQPFNDSLEEYKEVPSLEDLKAHPQMSTSDTLAALFSAISSKRFSFLRANFAAGDMIGHTGDMEAAVKAVEALDTAIGLLVKFAVYANFTVIITADHGNCEEMVLRDEKGSPLVNSEGDFVSKNSHTTSPVPFIVIDPLSRNLKLSADPSLGLSSVAASLCSLLGVKAPDSYDSPVISINYV